MNTPNPLLWHLDRPTIQRGNQQAIVIGVSLAAVTTLAYVLIIQSHSLDTLVSLLVLLSAGTYLFTPVMVAALTVIVTTQAIDSGEMEVLGTTLLEDRRFVERYFSMSLYRCRFLLAVMAGMTPPLLLPIIPMLLWGFGVTPYIVAGWTGVRLALAMGVRGALQNNRILAPQVFVPLQIFVLGALFLAGLTLAFLTILGPYFLMVVPLVLAEVMKDSAARWVRKA